VAFIDDVDDVEGAEEEHGTAASRELRELRRRDAALVRSLHAPALPALRRLWAAALQDHATLNGQPQCVQVLYTPALVPRTGASVLSSLRPHYLAAWSPMLRAAAHAAAPRQDDQTSQASSSAGATEQLSLSRTEYVTTLATAMLALQSAFPSAAAVPALPPVGASTSACAAGAGLACWGVRAGAGVPNGSPEHHHHTDGGGSGDGSGGGGGGNDEVRESSACGRAALLALMDLTAPAFHTAPGYLGQEACVEVVQAATAAVVERREPATWRLAAALLLRVARVAPEPLHRHLTHEKPTLLRCAATATAALLHSNRLDSDADSQRNTQSALALSLTAMQQCVAGQCSTNDSPKAFLAPTLTLAAETLRTEGVGAAAAAAAAALVESVTLGLVVEGDEAADEGIVGVLAAAAAEQAAAVRTEARRGRERGAERGVKEEEESVAGQTLGAQLRALHAVNVALQLLCVSADQSEGAAVAAAAAAAVSLEAIVDALRSGTRAVAFATVAALQPPLEAAVRGLADASSSSSNNKQQPSVGSCQSQHPRAEGAASRWAAMVVAAALPDAAGLSRSVLAEAKAAGRPLGAAHTAAVGMVLKLYVLTLSLAGLGGRRDEEAGVMHVLMTLLLDAAAPDAPTPVRSLGGSPGGGSEGLGHTLRNGLRATS